MGAKRLLRLRVQLPGLDVRFKLPIPEMRIELGESPPELSQLCGGQLSDLFLEILDLAHRSSRQRSASIR
jgi:hypothetical protein